MTTPTALMKGHEMAQQAPRDLLDDTPIYSARFELADGTVLLFEAADIDSLTVFYSLPGPKGERIQFFAKLFAAWGWDGVSYRVAKDQTFIGPLTATAHVDKRTELRRRWVHYLKTNPTLLNKIALRAAEVRQVMALRDLKEARTGDADPKTITELEDEVRRVKEDRKRYAQGLQLQEKAAS